MRRTFFLLSVMFWRRALPPGAAWWLCLVLVWMGGCASVPAPTVAMHQARIDLQTARASGAAVYDPVGLGFARNKFGQAQLAVSKGKFVKAAELAAESSADSRLAQTKALLGAVRLKIQHGIEANEDRRWRARCEKKAVRHRRLACILDPLE